MKKDVLVIGAAILDVLAVPTNESVFESGSYACEDIKISFSVTNHPYSSPTFFTWILFLR